MIVSSFAMRVARDTCVVGALLALATAWIAGRAGGLGIVAGALLAVGNFLWLARRASEAGAGAVATSSVAAWALASGLRLLATGVLCVLLFKLDVIHPVGLVAGLTLLPGAVIVQGLRAADNDA
jgi:hypothetical protein